VRWGQRRELDECVTHQVTTNNPPSLWALVLSAPVGGKSCAAEVGLRVEVLVGEGGRREEEAPCRCETATLEEGRSEQ